MQFVLALFNGQLLSVVCQVFRCMCHHLLESVLSGIACTIICWIHPQIKYINWFYHVTAINDWIYSEGNGPLKLELFVYLQTALWTAWAVPHQQTVLIAMTPPTSKWVPVSPTVGRASIRIPTPDSAQVKSMINQIATNLFQFHAQFEDVCSDCSFLQPITIGLLYKFWDRSRCNREGELEFLAIWSPCLIQTRQKMTFSW